MQSLYHQTGGDIDQQMAMKFDPLPFLVFYYRPTVTKQNYTRFENYISDVVGEIYYMQYVHAVDR